MANEGEGLRHWEESDCFFRSADWAVAFAQALAIRRDRQGSHYVDAQYVPTPLAAVVTLDGLGDDPGVLVGSSVTIMPVEPVGFEHVFRPGEVLPPPSF